MTREKMVEKLASSLNFIILNTGTGTLKDPEYSAMVADRILKLVENLGMQPPKVRDPVLFREENKWEDR